MKTLDEIQPERSAKVVLVYERDRQLLEYLDAVAVKPGIEVEVVSHNYDETLTLRIGSTPVQLGRSAAAKIWGWSR